MPPARGERGQLAGRVALVVGGGRGIGRRIAVRLAADGAAVAVSGRSAEALEASCAEIRGAGGRALAAPADVGAEADVAALASAVAAELGAVDVLVVASGVAGPTEKLWRLDLADWEQTLRVNLTGPFLACRAFAPAMVERGSGSIVLVGSATGKRPLPERTPYAASKTGLIGLVRSLAWELGPAGVRVNLVSPGPTEGERFDLVVERQAAAAGRAAAEVREEFRAAAPLGRLTGGEDVAAVVSFLAGAGAAAITGEDVNVSAGWVMH